MDLILQLTGFNTIRRRYRFKRRMPDSKRRLQDSNGKFLQVTVRQ